MGQTYTYSGLRCVLLCIVKPVLGTTHETDASTKHSCLNPPLFTVGSDKKRVQISRDDKALFALKMPTPTYHADVIVFLPFRELQVYDLNVSSCVPSNDIALFTPNGICYTIPRY